MTGGFILVLETGGMVEVSTTSLVDKTGVVLLESTRLGVRV